MATPSFADATGTARVHAGARTRARAAYEAARVRTGVRGVVLAIGLAVLASGLHRTTSATWLVAAMLAMALAVLGWRGGATRRGALAGVLAGLPPMLVAAVMMIASNEGHCAACAMTPSIACMMTCFVTSAIVGLAVGHRAWQDAFPRRFAMAAATTATLTGALGCGTNGLGGTLGIVIGLAVGGVTGWMTAARTAN